MAQVHKSTPLAPSSPLRWHPYLGSEIHGPGTQVDFGRASKPTLVAQARSGGNRTLGLKSMAQVLKPTPVAQVDSGSTFKPAPAATVPWV
jgi:hypothetical protein